MTAFRTCLAPRCAEPVGARRRVCEEHWNALPGRLRSRLSLSSRFAATPTTNADWDRAAQHLATPKQASA